MRRWLHASAPALPTVAVAIGLFGLRSAWAAILIYHAGIVAYLASAPDRGRALRWRGLSRWLFVAVPIAGAGGLVLAIGWPWFAREPGALAGTLAGLGLAGGSWRAFAIYYVLVNPFLEEAFWRGGLAPDGAPLHLQDAAFAFYHVVVLTFFLSPAWIALCFAVLVGVACGWRWMTRAWGGLAGPILTHLAADVGIVAAADWLLRN